MQLGFVINFQVVAMFFLFLDGLLKMSTESEKRNFKDQRENFVEVVFFR